MSQARDINANLPHEIQVAFGDNSINYYDPGSGDFFYTRVIEEENHILAQVARFCNCYKSGRDGPSSLS
jgi:hypothetical protein